MEHDLIRNNFFIDKMNFKFLKSLVLFNYVHLDLKEGRSIEGKIVQERLEAQRP